MFSHLHSLRSLSLQKKADESNEADKDESPFVISINYQPRKEPSVSLRFVKKSEAIDQKHSSSDLSSDILDDSMQGFARAQIAKAFDVKLPSEPKADGRHDAGRVRREISRLRRRLQSHPGEAIREDEEEKEDYDDDENKGPRPFNKEATLAITLDERNINLDMTVSTEKYGDICAQTFKKSIMDPLLAMMKVAGVENPFQDGKTVAVHINGLRVPGLAEYLAKELHRMKVGGACGTKLAPVIEKMPSNDVASHVAAFLETDLALKDLTCKEINSRVLAIAEPGTDLEDEAALNKGMFTIIIDQTESWNFHNEIAACGAFGGAMTLGVCFVLWLRAMKRITTRTSHSMTPRMKTKIERGGYCIHVHLWIDAYSVVPSMILVNSGVQQPVWKWPQMSEKTTKKIEGRVIDL